MPHLTDRLAQTYGHLWLDFEKIMQWNGEQKIGLCREWVLYKQCLIIKWNANETLNPKISCAHQKNLSSIRWPTASGRQKMEPTNCGAASLAPSGWSFTRQAELRRQVLLEMGVRRTNRNSHLLDEIRWKSCNLRKKQRPFEPENKWQTGPTKLGGNSSAKTCLMHAKSDQKRGLQKDDIQPGLLLTTSKLTSSRVWTKELRTNKRLEINPNFEKIWQHFERGPQRRSHRWSAN